MPNGTSSDSTVSVVIPTYRRAAFLRRAIECVLAQTFAPIEVIVVEDGSRDAADVAASFGDRVRYIWQENQGAAVARNTGVAGARGSWIAFLDDDDSWVPHKLERQLALVRAFPSIGFVHSNYFWLSNGKIELRPDWRVQIVPSGWVTQELVLTRFSINTSTALIRTDAIRRVGGFNPAYRVVQDYDLWIRLSQVCQFGYLADPLAYYETEVPEEPATVCRKSLTNIAILQDFVQTNRNLCRTWPQAMLRWRFHKAHLRCAQRHLWANEIETARRHFFKAWAWSPSQVSCLAYGLACLTGRGGVRTLRTLYRGAREVAGAE